MALYTNSIGTKPANYQQREITRDRIYALDLKNIETGSIAAVSKNARESLENKIDTVEELESAVEEIKRRALPYMANLFSGTA